MSRNQRVNPLDQGVDRGAFKKNQWDKILIKRAKRETQIDGKPITIYHTIGGSIADHI